MNKFAMTAATAALMLSLSAGALAASGLGSVTTMSGAGAEADKAGSVTINTTMCALELDDAGKITAVSFDIAQNKVGFDATGALTGELTGEHPTKKELGDGYGMKAASGIGKEWFEQAEALEDWCVGKTVEEVVTMPTYDKGDGRHTQVPDDVDLKTGCTIDMGSFLNALQEAADNAKSAFFPIVIHALPVAPSAGSVFVSSSAPPLESPVKPCYTDTNASRKAGCKR